MDNLLKDLKVKETWKSIKSTKKTKIKKFLHKITDEKALYFDQFSVIFNDLDDENQRNLFVELVKIEIWKSAKM